MCISQKLILELEVPSQYFSVHLNALTAVNIGLAYLPLNEWLVHDAVHGVKFCIKSEMRCYNSGECVKNDAGMFPSMSIR